MSSRFSDDQHVHSFYSYVDNTKSFQPIQQNPIGVLHVFTYTFRAQSALSGNVSVVFQFYPWYSVVLSFVLRSLSCISISQNKEKCQVVPS